MKWTGGEGKFLIHVCQQQFLVVLLIFAIAGSMAIVPQADASIKAGPIAAYSFDEGEGEVAGDLAGEHDGALEHTEWVKGKYGSAIYLDGNDDYVEIPDSAELQLTEEFTLEAWVRPDGVEDEAVAISKEAGNFYSYQLFAGSRNEAGIPEGFLAYEPWAWEDVEAEDPLVAKTWNHLALTYDGAYLRLYVNGQLVDTESSPPAQASEGPLVIGGNDDDEFFKGRIDEVRIYERTLDAGEVAADKGAPIQTPQTGPIAAYSFDEGEGEVAGDLAGEHDGAIEGAQWARGRYGSALEFDGVNDCISIPESVEFQFLQDEEFTLEAWVRPSGEDIEAIITQEDESAAEEEEPFAYSMLVGGEEAPRGWLRKGGESGHLGVSGGDPLPLHTWSHIAFTDDGATLRFYVNGELIGEQPAIPLTAAEGPMTIGCLANYGNYFKGRIDEVRIYERTLSAGEVRPDTTPPTVPADIEAIIEPEEAETEVSWSPSSDPSFVDGQPGSGVHNYSFRYRVGSEEWSGWQTTAETSFVIPETKENDPIRLNLFAADVTGNISPFKAVDLLATPTAVTPESLGEEEINEQGDANLAAQPANLGKSQGGEGSSLLAEFDEKLCGSNPSPCGKYNGRAAASYAIRWNLIGQGNEEARFNSNRNFDYFGGLGGDCSNYVSQALYNGGVRFMRANGVNDPDARDPEIRSEFEHGEDSWWSYFYLVNNGPFSQRAYEVTESWVRAEVLREQLLDNGLAKVVGPSERLRAGDVIFYNLHGLDMSEADHSQIVVRVGKHRAWVSQHSPGYRQTLRRVINRNDTPDHKLNVDWKFQVVRPIYTAANIEG